MAKFLGNAVGIVFFLAAFLFFLESSMKIPVSELSSDGTCLRVLDEKGTEIQNGCRLMKRGELKTDKRYVGK